MDRYSKNYSVGGRDNTHTQQALYKYLGIWVYGHLSVFNITKMEGEVC